MRKLFLALLLLLTLPLPVLAEDYEDCDEGTAECSCPQVDASGVDQDAVTSIEGCQEACTALEPYGEEVFGAEITSYSVQCEIDGVVTTIGQGALTSDEELITITTTDPIAPELSVEIPGLEFEDPIVVDGFVEYNLVGLYIEAMYKWVLGAASLLAIVMLMLGGLQYMLARGKPEGIGKAKKRIRNSITGIVLLFAAFSIAYMVDPGSTTFDSLKVTDLEPLAFDFPNETPLDFPAVSSYALSSTAAEGGIGWDDVVIYDQKAWPDVAYGEDECLTSSTGSIMSSGCGVASFAMVASTILGESVDPPYVAGYWKQAGSCEDVGIEGYSDKCRACPDSNVCDGCNGTFGSAMTHSELTQALGIEGSPIGTDGYTLSSDDMSDMYDKLASGDYLVISSYTTSSGGGHFVVLVGVDSDGNFMINNPYGAIMETRDPETYYSTMKSGYIFERYQ